MLVILSQKIDTRSLYSDDLFNTYHYPARYRNQLHKGDEFVYYQGNRFDKAQRYYFGVGTIGEITSTDRENYFAKLLNCRRFEKKVPIYLPDGGYIEQIDYQEVRKRVNPPWQSSIRPVSQKAFDYILRQSGVQLIQESEKSVDLLKEELKRAIREFYLMNNDSAIQDIENISSDIALLLKGYNKASSAKNGLFKLIDYCKSMKMSYSYKAVLILALLSIGKEDGSISIESAVQYFRSYYDSRREQGKAVEKKQCIYFNPEATNQQIAANIISNPVKTLAATPFFNYDVDKQVFSISPEIWSILDKNGKLTVMHLCRQKLNNYFSG